MYIYGQHGGGSRRTIGVKQTEKHLCALTMNRLYVNWRYSCRSIGNGASVRHTASASGTISREPRSEFRGSSDCIHRSQFLNLNYHFHPLCFDVEVIAFGIALAYFLGGPASCGIFKKGFIEGVGRVVRELRPLVDRRSRRPGRTTHPGLNLGVCLNSRQ